VTETGSSLRANRLRIVDTVLESATVFIMIVRRRDSWKREKAENLILMCGAIAAASKVGLSSTSIATICRLF